MAITKFKLVDGKLPIKDIISRLNEMRPDIKELEDFDMRRTDDYVYCIEWGMKKQKWMEQSIYDVSIKDLTELIDSDHPQIIDSDHKMCINWRSIKDVGNPTDSNKTYLVTDGNEISTSDINVAHYYKGDGNPILKFRDWIGDENTYEDNSCCSGERCFDLVPTHWCPTDEINLP